MARLIVGCHEYRHSTRHPLAASFENFGSTRVDTPKYRIRSDCNLGIVIAYQYNSCVANNRVAVVFGCVAILVAFGLVAALRERRPVAPSPPIRVDPSTGSSGSTLQSTTGDESPNRRGTQSSERLRNLTSDEIVSELARGGDSSTGLEFKIGPDGGLLSAPTRRVTLLDQLIRLDPKAAAQQARQILGQFTSADEWAIALRACALADSSPDGRAYLKGRMRAMLGHEAWQENPSVGFLEAFDVAVYLGGTNLMTDLAGLLRRTDNRALAHAAYLALDRLTIAEPASALQFLQTHPALMEGREVTRANFFARADVSDATQRAVVESYLLANVLRPEELRAFTGLFPSANYMISHSLLTRINTPDGATLARRDRAALAVVNEWLADRRFESVKSELEGIRRRIEQFVGQSGNR